jgi:hypothetical protein
LWPALACPRWRARAGVPALVGQVIEWQRRVAVCQTAAMVESAESAVSRRVWRRLEADPKAALEHGLNPADLQAALMDVSRSRAAAVTPARLMQRWRQDRYVQPVVSDPGPVWQLEARLWALLPDEFAGVDLSPVAPLGTCSAVGPVSQDRVISTTRGTEVVSDPTNVLALEAAVRRQRSRAQTVGLASCHQVLRGQPFDEPGLFQHFRLFALVTSDRDRGSGRTEAAMLTSHLRFWGRALSEVLPARRVALRYTVFGFPPLHERMRDTVLPALQPLPGRVAVDEDAGRQRALGYYERAAIRIDAEADGARQEVGDGGFTDWTARLLNDAKERCLISCVSTGRLAALARLGRAGPVFRAADRLGIGVAVAVAGRREVLLERERVRGRPVRAHVLHPVFGLGHGGDVPARYPPQGRVRVPHPLVPLPAPSQHREVGVAEHVRGQRLDRLPDGHVDQNAAAGPDPVLLEAADGEGVPVLGLHPPEESGRRIRDRVHRVKRRHEVRDQRTVDRREQPSNVDLREHIVHGAHAA